MLSGSAAPQTSPGNIGFSFHLVLHFSVETGSVPKGCQAKALLAMGALQGLASTVPPATLPWNKRPRTVFLNLPKSFSTGVGFHFGSSADPVSLCCPW